MKLTMIKSVSLCLTLLTIMTLVASQALAHSVIIGTDTSFDDWFLTAPLTAPGANYPASTGRIARNTQEQGEFIWRDASKDQRLISTAVITEDVDLRTFRVTADKDNLYILLKVENVTNNSGPKAPEFQVAIDTTLDNNGNTALVDGPNAAAPANTLVNPQAAWEYMVQTNFQAGNLTPPRVYSSPTQQDANGTKGYLRTSGDDAAELSIPWSKIGNAPGVAGKRLRFSVATLYSDRTDTATPLGNGSKVMDTMNPTQNAADDLVDDTIDYYVDVSFAASGEVVSPLLISEFLPNPAGTDNPGPNNTSVTNSEWVEIYNPNSTQLSLNGYKIGNAAQRGGDSQAMLKFPANATIAGNGVVLVARDKRFFNKAPTGYAIPSGVPMYGIAQGDLTPYTTWANGNPMSLGNGPDEDQILLLDTQDTIVDQVTYADVALAPTLTPGTVPIAFTGSVPEDVSYERCPVTRDTNDNSLDFIAHTGTAAHTPGVVCSGNADLTVALAAPATAAINHAFNYVLSYSNTGANINNAYITTTLPANVTYVAGSQVVGANTAIGVAPVVFTQPTANVLQWRIPRLASGSGTITFSALVDNDASIIGQTRVTTAQVQSNLPDPTPANNTASASFQITDMPQVNIGISKQLTSPTATFFNGRQAVYTLTYSNTGDLAADSTTITDQVPAGLTFVSASPVQPQVSGSNLVFNVGTLGLPLNQTVVLTFTVSASDAGGDTLANTATIATATAPEPILTNNTSTDTHTTVAAPAVDLALTKTADKTTAKIGEEVTYTLQVTNSGIGTATNITLKDTLPTGMTYVATSAGSFGEPSINGNELTWAPLTGFSVAPKASATVQFRAKITEVDPNAVLVNHAVVTVAGDPNLVDNSASSNPTTALADVDLGLTKTADTDNIAVGDAISYTFTLNNTGVDTATNIQIVDTLPISLTYKASSTSSTVGEPVVSSDGRTLTWTLPAAFNVVPGATTTFGFKAIAHGNQGNVIVNTAVANTTGDPNLGNNSAASIGVTIMGVNKRTAYLPIVIK